MVDIYVDLVIAGERSLDGKNGVPKVPKKYISEVIAGLEARGYSKDNIK